MRAGRRWYHCCCSSSVARARRRPSRRTGNGRGAATDGDAGPEPTSPTVEEPVAAAVRGNQPVVIDEGTDQGSGPQGLAAAAAAERERRRQAPPPMRRSRRRPRRARHRHASISQGPPSAGASAAPATSADEAYWSDRARGSRQRWRQSADEVDRRLEKESGGLRWKFYAEDDPYVRDQQIKPEWDRVLDDLRRARQDGARLPGPSWPISWRRGGGRRAARLAARRDRAGAAAAGGQPPSEAAPRRHQSIEARRSRRAAPALATPFCRAHP